jgi:uncharacterized membrane protein
MHYFPLAWPFLLALALLGFVVFALIEIGVLNYAYARMGIPARYVLGVLLLSLLGGAINIPVAELPPEEVVSGGLVDFYGMRYVVPVVHEWPGTVIAINVGGALIPVILSCYLLAKHRFYLRAVLAVSVVALIVHFFAHPVRGIGISVPAFIAPIAAALTAMVFMHQQPAPLAYVAGTMGTLIGADLLNLDKIQGLAAPIASIGGAGTFDGVFLAGILAVLLSPIWGRTSFRGNTQGSDQGLPR